MEKNEIIMHTHLQKEKKLERAFKRAGIRRNDVRYLRTV